MVGDLPAECIGGPLDGRVLPAGTIPWTAWIPRDMNEPPRPARSLTEAEVLHRSHYSYSGVRLGRALHVWQVR